MKQRWESIPPTNFEQRHLPCIYVVDYSGSMEGEPIQNLNNAMKHFVGEYAHNEALMGRLDVCIISFADEVKIEVGFRPGANYEAPELTASGLTSLNQAILTALDAADARIEEYEELGIRYSRPMVFVITDGYATDDQLELTAVDRMRQYISARRISFLPIAIGYADEQRLQKYYPDEYSHKPVPKLSYQLFKEIFSWSIPYADNCSKGINEEFLDTMPVPSDIDIRLEL